MQNLQKICDIAEVSATYGEMAAALNARIHETLYDAERGLYTNRVGDKQYSELVNSLAILCGAATAEEAKESVPT